ncbi:YihY/virulence factor BrkB family protein [Caenispirillum bisanense]|uniref:YihY/virulence factor BrkB family protein n=1 Tax=Caenispirillum bisanense TaxID=414052 RepID=UPI0031DDED26
MTRHSDRHGRQASKPTDIPKRGLRDVALRVKDQIGDDNISIVAAGIAFFGILSIFPALAALLTLYGLVASPQDVTGQIQTVAGMLPPDVQQIIQDQLQRVASASGGALGFGAIVGLLAALWSASKGMKALVTGIDIAYDEREERGFVKRTLVVLGLTLGAIVFVIVALGVITVVPAVVAALGLPATVEWAVLLGRWPLLVVLVMLALAVVYRVAPDRDEPQWRWVTPGSALAAVLWIVGSILFSLYVRNFGSYNESYGALAGVVMLLLWLYLSAFVVLLGAEVNCEMERQTRHDTTQGHRKPMGQRDAHAADTLGRTRR